MASVRRTFLPLVLLGMAALCAWNMNEAFVSAPRTSNNEVMGQQKLREGAVLGLATGLLTAEPAHAGGGPFFDEILPYAMSISFAIIWGIILGFVLLRLQEAFPE
ncbi:unnamed protein product [Durusdinium trenchii]|uniref:Uncharacterized protein n=1 Tax=Durusdinium trenchii TaxID=1381693 RepID=A0ABP0L362_9DINO